ncbi:MAG TPA: biopolymer transporter ExbD [Rhodocyclaceae bacterium]|jgi:biopolymer transport protein ExbD|nr:biopolymer transporter ExbD [Rhodocyclaceae bacterium]
MNFQRGRYREEPEINFIPLIDVLLVILIFLMVTTTYSKFSGLEINLPTADGTPPQTQPAEINVAVTATGDVLVNKIATGRDPQAISNALKNVAGGKDDTIVVISADKDARHQSVIDVMEAAQTAGLSHISFATQSSK